nr:hypothetical protein [Tanacetum cinerariifolium]
MQEGKVDSSKALDASLVVTECSGTKSDKHDTSSSLENYITHAVDAYITPVNDQVPFAEVQLTAQHNVLANEQQHNEQSEPIYDTYLLEKVNNNTTPDSINMSHRGGEIDQDAEQYQVKRPEPILMTSRQISSRLVPNPVPAAPYVPLTNKDLEILFQPMFDEYLEPPSIKRLVPPGHAVQVLVVSAGTPSSTTIDQDAPSTSHSPSSLEVQAPILHQGVAAGPTFEDNPFAQADNDPFVNMFTLEPSFEESSSGDVSTAESNQESDNSTTHTMTQLLRLDNVLAERLGLTESQPHVDQLMVPIHHSPDQRVVGASALTFSLEVSNFRVKKMRENIANHVSALRGVFVPLSEPLSAAALEGMEGTSGSTPDVAATLSTTLVSASTIPPISTDDYEVAHVKSQGGSRVDDETATDDDMDLFISNADLNISE